LKSDSLTLLPDWSSSAIAGALSPGDSVMGRT
jgi:hypothetical protein